MKKKLLLGLVALSLVAFAGCKKEEAPVEAEEKKFTLEEETPSEEVTEEANTQLNYILYLRFEDQEYLYDEMFSVKEEDIDLENQSLEAFLVQQLIDVVPVRNLISPIPEGTKLLGVEKADGIVTVNLSKEFNPNGLKKNEAGLALASIVNTLTLIDGNEQVKILIEGEEVKDYYGVAVDSPLYYIDSYFPDK